MSACFIYDNFSRNYIIHFKIEGERIDTEHPPLMLRRRIDLYEI